MIKFKIFVIVMALWSAHVEPAFSFIQTQSDACSHVDLRSSFSLKMRDQGNISWCYAHAAADYLQVLNQIPVQISAADIAVNYNHRRWPRFLRWLQGGVVPETGFIRSAMYDISLVGYCPEEYFPSETWTKRIMIGEGAGTTVQVPLGNAVEEISELVSHVQNGIFLIPTDLPFVYEFKGVTHQQFYDAVFVNPKGNVLDELRSAACDSHRQPFPKALTGINMAFKNKSIFLQINEVLNQQRPVTVDFFYGFLENSERFKKRVSELHTTLLFGRRFNPGTEECQYLIKNSYGTDCSSYDQRHQCEAGYVWVNESSLYQAMTSFVHVSKTEEKFKGTAEQIQDDL